jgi:hypothetical protein
MGIALSRTLTRTFPWKTLTTWITDFSQVFIEETGIVGTRYVVPPDALADKTQSAQDTFLKLVEPPADDMPSRPWAYHVASNFVEIALPIFTRQYPLTANTATALRITALCLAAEADTRGAQPVGSAFREIAAGVTHLERRLNRQTLPTETIILSTT